MSKNRVLSMVLVVFSFAFSLHGRAHGQSGWKVFDDDAMATYYYEIDGIVRSPGNVASVWNRVIVKKGNEALMKTFFPEECSCKGIQLAHLIRIETIIEIDCPNLRYQPTEGSLRDNGSICICEPDTANRKWKDIPPEPAIQRLSKLLCD